MKNVAIAVVGSSALFLVIVGLFAFVCSGDPNTIVSDVDIAQHQ